MSDLKFISKDYVPKGELKGFPLEVIDKMMSYQREADVRVFEKKVTAKAENGGFDWSETPQKEDFWVEVIGRKNFNNFFELYSKESNLTFPRVVEVKVFNESWEERVGLFISNNKIYCLEGEKTLDDIRVSAVIYAWEKWREVEEKPKPQYVPFEWEDRDLLRNKWVRLKRNNSECKVMSFEKDLNSVIILDTRYNFKELLNKFEFLDGTPCGKLKK